MNARLTDGPPISTMRAAKKMARLAHAMPGASNAPKVLASTPRRAGPGTSVDIAREVLRVDADENLGDDTERFTDPHVADRANAVPRTPTSPRT
jgi:hypothetical protein